MKLALVVSGCALALAAQEYKNLVVPVSSGGQGMTVRALEIVRETPYPSVIHAKGSVQIKSHICVRTGPGNTQSCDGYLIVHADQADIREDTLEITPVGHVTITHEK